MGLPAYARTISSEEYLDGERHSPVRHEYVNGAVYAMGGASDAHNTIALNVATILRNHLRGGPCRAFISDMKTRIRSLRDDRFYYPDCLVTCAGEDRDRPFKEHPRLIVEVLSQSTERTDRGEKFDAYRRLDSLEEYVLIAQDTRRVEIYRRTTDWALELCEGEAGEFHLSSPDLDLTLDQVYEDVTPVPYRFVDEP